MPASLHSRGALAGAGSAISLIAAALASLIFAAGLIGFTAWPAGSHPSVQSVVVPAAPSVARGDAAARGAAAVVLPVTRAASARAAGPRAAIRTLARPIRRHGAAPVVAGAPAVAATPTAPASVAPAQTTTSVTRQVTSTLAGTTTAVTDQAGGAVGGPVGAAIQATGDTIAQTLVSVGAATPPLLGR